MKLRNLAAVLGLAGGGLLAGQAQALFVDGTEIDDLDFTGTESVRDTTADGTPVTSTARGTGGSGEWVSATGTRQGGTNALYVNLLTGDAATTDDCGNCNVGHTTTQSSSTSHNFFTFRGNTLTANAGGTVSFDYETDIDGGDFFLTFSLDGAKVGDTFQWSDVAATGLSAPPPRPLIPTLQGTLTQTFDYNDIRLDVFSNGGTYTDPTGWLGTVSLGDAAIGLDTNIANPIPEPTTLALLSLGMVGIGWQRRRARA